jgi:hypothetical protein
LFLHRKKKDKAIIISPPQNLHPLKHSGFKEGYQLSYKSNDESGTTDLVIGALSGYSFEDVQYWVNSLDRSGFRGHKLVIVYEAAYEIVDQLLNREYQVITFSQDDRKDQYFYPVEGFRHEDSSIDRFYQIWRFLQLNSSFYRFVISVDTRDVIFQTNPSVWLEENLGDMKLNVGYEGLQIFSEPWNSEMVLKSYGPDIYQQLSINTIVNAGTIAGYAGIIKDLALNVFLTSQHNKIPFTDQAAMNIILSLEPYKSITRFNHPEDNWACQAATIAHPENVISQSIPISSSPPVLSEGIVITPSGQEYCLVHQYERIPEWKVTLQNKYKH